MTNEKPNPQTKTSPPKKAEKPQPQEQEIGGFKDSGLLEPTRYNDWEVKGRCSDF